MTEPGIAAVPGVDYEALMSDGGVVRVRLLRADDGESLRALLENVSDQNLYLRFFSQSREAANTYMDQLVITAQTEDHVALAAEVGDVLVAVAGYERIDADEAEVAFLVDDAHHGRGLGTLLLEALATLGRRRGIQRFFAVTLG